MERSDLAPVLGGITFYPEPHEYVAPDGHKLMGVTTLMNKYGLGVDYSHVSKEYLNQRAAAGTSVHELLQLYDGGMPTVETADVKAYKKAVSEAGLRVIASEYLISDGERIASSIDKVFADGSLGDVKTTSTIHRNAVGWQLSIYAYLFERQNPGKTVPHLYVVWVRGGECRIEEVARHPDAEIARLLMAEANGEPTFTPDSAALPAHIEAIAARVGEREAAKALLKAKLKELETDGADDLAEMQRFMGGSNAPKSIPCGGFNITLVNPGIRKTFDAKWLERNMPALYNEHLKTTTVAGSIRITPIDNTK